MKSYNKVDIAFQVQKIGIDTFTIPFDEIAKRGYQCLSPFYEIIENGMAVVPHQNVGDYLSKDVLREVASIRDEATVVLDIQVGKGKTQACYDLICDYCQEDDNVVLMVSPFRKLVDKDYGELKSRGLSPFNYMQLRNDESYADTLEAALNSKVHVMTVNCLLGNAGEDSFAQAFVKSNYLTLLYNKCKAEGKRVTIFFDEIHEAIDNFAPQLFPNLLQWADAVQKCFVSSATYTIAVYPVLKYIALLTNKTIVELHVQRHKWKAENISKLHLHIITEEYSGGNISPLAALKTILEVNVDRQVNILTAHKSVIRAVLRQKDGYGRDNPFYEAAKPYKFNEVHGDTNNVFNEKGNNIGTTFKTGVNVDNPDSVLVIILPVVKQNAPDSIFADGVPSIIQALARQRKGGNIHILMYDPAYLIEPDPQSENWVDEFGFKGYRFFDTYKPLRERLDAQLTANKKQVYHIDQHRALNILWDEYKKRYDRNAAIIEVMRKFESDGTTQTGFQYPTFEQYLTDEGTRLLVKNYPQFGGDLSSYVLWAAMNSQFVNAELASISYYTENTVDIRLAASDMKGSLLSQLPAGTLQQLNRTSLKTVRETVNERIQTSTWVTMDGEKEVQHNRVHKFFIDGKRITFGALVRDNRYLSALIDVTQEVNGVTYAKEDVKREYITQNMVAALGVPTANRTPLVASWQELYAVEVAFIDYCKSCLKQNASSISIIPVDAKDNMPMQIAHTMKEIVNSLRELDVVIGGKAISLLQAVDEKEDAKLQAAMFRELRELFTNITDERTGSGKEKNKYFKVDGPLERPFPNKSILRSF
jgi:hypothetical protein